MILKVAIVTAFVFFTEAFGGASSFLVFRGTVPSTGDLRKDDFRVEFSAEGVLIASKKPLTWTSDTTNRSAVNFQDLPGEEESGFTHRYLLPITKSEAHLTRSTIIKIQGKAAVVEIDKEALPIVALQQIAEARSSQASPGTWSSGFPWVRVSVSLGGLLLLVGVLVVAIRKKGLKGNWLGQLLRTERFKSGPLLETVSTHPIGPKKQIVVLRAGGEYLLIGCSGDHMTLLTRIDEQSVVEENSLLENEILEKRGIQL